jgi:hypothetical protein
LGVLDHFAGVFRRVDHRHDDDSAAGLDGPQHVVALFVRDAHGRHAPARLDGRAEGFDLDEARRAVLDVDPRRLEAKHARQLREACRVAVDRHAAHDAGPTFCVDKRIVHEAFQGTPEPRTMPQELNLGEEVDAEWA